MASKIHQLEAKSTPMIRVARISADGDGGGCRAELAPQLISVSTARIMQHWPQTLNNKELIGIASANGQNQSAATSASATTGRRRGAVIKST